ncbi:VOC family protein [Brevibacterium sp.]|uniref:VOC family protein n=1 Tax=Brevibacterium sp. TaxID=1701 RepID=UPI0028122705|nr:VOC family protein [Brevibacterium sp.]
MKPLTTVLSLPVSNPEVTLTFYRDGLGLDTEGIDEGIVAFELPNLSLFFIETNEYLSYLGYSGNAELPIPAPGATIISCAFGSPEEIDDILRRAEFAGGRAYPPVNEDGSYMGYFSDPDGHIWELVANATTAQAAAAQV